MQKDLVQEYLYNLPDDLHYGVEFFVPDKGWQQQDRSIILKGRYEHVPKLLTYDEADKIYREYEKGVRLVKYSRYLVKDTLTVTEIKKCK